MTYDEGLRFLRECRRVLKPTGVMLLVVPNAGILCSMYSNWGEQNYGEDACNDLAPFDEINDEAAKRPTSAGKLWELLVGGDHKAIYDAETLGEQLKAAGFHAFPTRFRCIAGDPVGTQFKSENFQGAQQILHETSEMDFGGISLFMDAVPQIA